MFLKKKQVRLVGESMRRLVNEVYERDQHKCVICQKWVEYGHKPHHVLYKSHGGGDTLDNMVLLCNDCHHEVHCGKKQMELKDKLERYLEWMHFEN